MEDGKEGSESRTLTLVSAVYSTPFLSYTPGYPTPYPAGGAQMPTTYPVLQLPADSAHILCGLWSPSPLLRGTSRYMYMKTHMHSTHHKAQNVEQRKKKTVIVYNVHISEKRKQGKAIQTVKQKKPNGAARASNQRPSSSVQLALILPYFLMYFRKIIRSRPLS